MGALRLFGSAVKGNSLRRVLLWGAALASLTALLLPPPLALARPLLAPAPSVSLEAPAQTAPPPVPPAANPAAGIPSVALGVPGSVFIGDSFTFTVTFDNTGTTGYGPFIDLIFPVNGADGAAGTDTPDGIDFDSATYLGAPLTAVELIFPASGGGCVNHPYARETTGAFVQVCGTAGDKLVVLQLPFGSFTPTQPAAVVTVGATLSNLADLGTPLTLRARGGFRFGNTPLDDWCCDPVILLPDTTDGSGWPNDDVTPTLMTITKAYSGPEDETATGPNFPRQYTITVTIAPDQEVTDLDVTDDLPNNLAFLGVDSISPAGSVTDSPTVGTAANPPNNRLVVNFPSVTSVTGPATVTFSFFVPRLDANGLAVLPADTGNDATSANRTGAVGDWDPFDTRDAGGTDNAVAGGVCPACAILHTLNDRSIAIQKSGSPGSGAPGTVITYTLSFQISDYFTFGDLVVTDAISDGQRLLVGPGFEPSLSVTDRVETRGGLFTYTAPAYPPNPPNPPAPGDDLLIDISRIGNSGPGVPPDGTDGSTVLTFRVSEAMTHLGAGDGVLQGGRAIVPNAGPATGTITYYARIQDIFSDTYPSTDPSVDQGDRLSNSVSIFGTVRDNANITQVIGDEADDSSAGATIPRGAPAKSIYAVDGTVCSPQPCTAVEVDPGDTLTYRLQYGLPTSDFEDLTLTDYLPLPVLHAVEVTTFDPTVDGSAPPAGTAKFGPADTFFNSRPGFSSIAPPITTDSVGNSVTFTYGDYDDPTVPPPSTAVDILFTVTVSNDPFTDRLLLTNQLRVHEGSTNSSDVDADNIVQFTLREPFLVVKKGVIATDQPPPVIYTPGTTGPVAFSGPGTPGPRFAGTINSNGLTATPVDSDLSGVDADDLVSFAITIENQGSSPSGAFDIVITDTLQPGFIIPGGGLNLTITRGDGSAVAFLGVPADLFGAGIELVDPGSGPGVCEAHSLTSGRNIIVITYDLEVDPSAEPSQVILNTAEVTHYAGEEGGDDHTGTVSNPAFQDQASTTIATVGLAKDVTDTNQGFTSGLQVAIGEIVEYSLTATVPEGTSTEVTLTDTLVPGLAFVALDSLTASSGDLTWTGAGTPTISEFPVGSGLLVDQGRRMVVDFGDMTNANTDDAIAETITLVYRVVVLNSGGNQHAPVTLLNNTAVWEWSEGSSTTYAPEVSVVEPVLQVLKVAVPNSGDAGDTITFTLTINHAASSNADAFDLTLSDILPAGMTYTGGTLDCAGGSLLPDSCGFGGNTLTAAWTQPTGFALGSTSQFTFDVTLDSTVAPGQILTNTANLAWTSLPGDVATAQTPNNSLSVERTGDAGGPGGALNNYRAAGSAQVTIFSQPDKSIVATSESHTGFVGSYERLTIGEIVRYRMVFQLAEGSAINFQLRDLLPPGLRFRDDNTAKAALVSNDPAGGITSTTLSGPGLAVSGEETTVATITPTFVLPDNAISISPTAEDDSYDSGTDPYFKLGDLSNADRDVDQEFVVLEFNAVVENIVGNQGYNNTATPPTAIITTLDNGFEVWVNGALVTSSATVPIGVSEPALTLAKTITTTPADAGDFVVYRYTVTNVSGATASAAFELQFSDTLDPNLAFQSISLFSLNGGNCGAVVPAFSGSAAGQVVSASLTCLNTGGTALIDLTARVIDAAPMGADIPNSVTVRYSSLPGDSGSSPNPTGSTTPGAPGSVVGERIGVTPVVQPNDYVRASTVSLSLVDPAITKTVFGTSILATGSAELDPAIDDLVVGEEVTFRITVTLPEGVAPITISDDLPTVPPDQGVLGIVSSRVIAIGNRLSGSALAVGDPGVHSDTDADTFLDRAVFAFGILTNSPDGVVDDEDRITVEVVARLANIGPNQGGDRLTDTATVDWGLGSDSAAADVETVEPLLTITKTADDDTPALGQTVTYTLTLSHAPTSTADAQDVVVTDSIPAGLTYVAGSATAPLGWAADATGAPTLVFRGSLTQAAVSVSFTYRATLGIVPVGQTFTNTASATWTSIPGPDGNERTGTGVGPNDYATTAAETVTASEIDLTLTKDDGGISAVPGQMYAYTLTIRNIGNVNATGVTVTDTVPPYTTFAGPSGPGAWSCGVGAPSGTVCTLAVGNLAPAGIVPLVFSVAVDASLPVTIDQTSNTARVDGLNEPVLLQGDNSDTEITPLDAAPDLTIDKDDLLTVVAPGTPLAYTLTFDNVGDQDATGVTITDVVPLYTTFNPAGSTPGWSCVPDNNPPSVCTLTVGGLPVGAGPLAVTFAVNIDSSIPVGVNLISNTASIADDGTNGSDQTPADNSDDDVDNLVTLPNTDLTKTLFDTSQLHTGGLNAAIGEILTYRLEIAVPAGGTMNSATLTDTLDPGLALVDCVAISGPGLTFTAACNPPTNPTLGPVPPGDPAPENQGRRIVFDLGNVSNLGLNSATLTIDYTVVVLDSAANMRGGTMANAVVLEWTGGALTETAPDVTLVEPTLTLTKTAAPTSGPPGTPITFTLTIGQAAASDSAAFDLLLEDVVPVGLTYIPGSLTVSGGPLYTTDETGAPTLLVRWDGFGLGETATIQFQATLGNLGAGNGVTNTARLEWTSLPDNPPASLNLSSYNTLATERRYDPANGVDLYGVTASASVTVPRLPDTGFAPDRITPLHGPNHLMDLGDLRLEIPALGIGIPITGVPAGPEGWDLTWLAGQAGYLEGTAYPTHSGNSALTAHVTLPNGRPGPFARLGDLRWGDRVVVHAYGKQYVYEVRSVVRVNGGDLRPLGHKDQAWLTLITCRTYDEAAGRYLHRLVVQAVLVDVADG